MPLYSSRPLTQAKSRLSPPRVNKPQAIGAPRDNFNQGSVPQSDWWSQLTGGATLQDGGGSHLGSTSSPRDIAEIILGYGQNYGKGLGISNDIWDQIAKTLPDKMRYNERAAQSLDPMNDPARYRSYRQQAVGAGQRSGRTVSNLLRNQGLGPEAQAAAYLDAQNNAEDQAGQFLGQINSPEDRASRYSQAASLSGIEPYLQELGMTNQQFQTFIQALLQNEGLNVNQEGFKLQADQSKGSLFDDLLGIASGAVPFMMGGGGSGADKSYLQKTQRGATPGRF